MIPTPRWTHWHWKLHMHTHHFCLSLDEMIPERLRLLRKAWVSREMTELWISSSLQLVPHGNTWSERQNLHKNKWIHRIATVCINGGEILVRCRGWRDLYQILVPNLFPLPHHVVFCACRRNWCCRSRWFVGLFFISHRWGKLKVRGSVFQPVCAAKKPQQKWRVADY